MGASVAAGVSIVVALLIVKKTNAHQSVLSDRALAEQRKRDAEALEVQRVAFQEQLEQQRAETSRLRFMDIRADVVADASHVVDAAIKSMEKVDASLPALTKSIARWRIESSDPKLKNELKHWPNLIGTLAKAFRDLEDSESATLDQRNQAFLSLSGAAGSLSSVAVNIPNDRELPRDEVQTVLSELRKSLENRGLAKEDDN